MNIISKIGQRDNVITYEHICDTRADMGKIEPRYITLGSTCIVLAGESGMEVYMADSTHEWHDLLVSSGSGSGTPSGLSIHICGEDEVQGGKPNVLAPLETELYLVPAREDSGNLYDEYVWVNGEWELFGGAPVSLERMVTQESLDEALATKLSYGGSVASASMLVSDGIVSVESAMEKPGAIKIMLDGDPVNPRLFDNNNNFIPMEQYNDRTNGITYSLFTDLDNGTYTLKIQQDDVYFYLWDENGNQITANASECQLIVNNNSRAYIISGKDLSDGR